MMLKPGIFRHVLTVPMALLLCTCAMSCRTLDAVLFAYPQIRSSLESPRQTPPAHMDIRQGIAVVHVYGTPAEMGQQYGQLLKEPLNALFRFAHGIVPAAMMDNFLQYAKTHEADLPSDMREELQAISKSSGVPYMELVTINIIPKLACSTLAVWKPASPDHHLIMGRNSDYFSLGLSDRGMMIVVHHPREGLATASVSFLGMIGAFTGVNQSGVAYGNMLVFNAAGSQQREHGLPIQLALQQAAARAGNADAMAALLSQQAHAIPMNVMVADRDQALVLELGLEQTCIRREEKGVLVSTNHFRTPGLYAHTENCRRYASLLSAGQRANGSMSVSEMESALYDAHIRGLNLQAVVFEPAAMRMWVSINRVPAAAGPYVEFDLNELFTAPPLGRAQTAQP